MKRTIEIFLIYATGLTQGLALVTVPAASAVLTDPNAFGFSQNQYGMLFIPQVLMAIGGSLLGPKLSKTWGLKTIYCAGLIFNIIAMGTIAASQWFVNQPTIAFLFLFLGTTAVGAGFGITLPMINIYAERFFPGKSATAITALHTLLGTGTALAPLLVALLVKQVGWWIMPLAGLFSFSLILLLSLNQPLKGERQTLAEDVALPQTKRSTLPRAFWLFVAVAFLYGYCETIFANWAIIYLNKEKIFPADKASLALSVFWGMVTVGRLLITLLTVRIAPRLVYRILPLMMVAALWTIPLSQTAIIGILLFGFAGLACSAFFPLSFSLAQKQFASLAETVSGALMASYMLGYGLASYGLGEILSRAFFSLSHMYRGSSFVALAVFILAVQLTQTKPAKAHGG